MYNDDNSSTVSPVGNSSTQSPQQPTQFIPPTLPEEPKRQGRALKVVSVLLILALLGAGAMAYMWYSAMQSQEESSAKIEQLSKDNSELEAKLESNSQENDAATQSEPIELSREDSILQTAKEYTQLMNIDYKELEYKITKSSEIFAIVSFGNESGSEGGKLYLERAPGEGMGDEKWVVIHEGQNVPSEEVIKRFGIPAEFIGTSS